MENRGCDVAKKYGVSFVVAVVPPFLIPYFPPTVFFPFILTISCLWSWLWHHLSRTFRYSGQVIPSIKSQRLNFVKSNLIEILNTNYASISVTSVVEVKQHHNYLIVRLITYSFAFWWGSSLSLSFGREGGVGGRGSGNYEENQGIFRHFCFP